jgi:Rieske Fe-S protein
MMPIKLVGGLFNRTTAERIKPGEGGVIKKGEELVAVYKDEDGDLRMMSAKCTHKGCTVFWNKKEKTWDCPCHGSRFDKYGKVINGPAERNLGKY